MKKKILIIESISVLLKLLMIFLEEAGYEVKGTDEEEEGKNLLKFTNFDLILLGKKSVNLSDLKALYDFEDWEERITRTILLHEKTLKEKINHSNIVFLKKPIHPVTLLRIIESNLSL